jgi:hypothetical protein
MLHKWIRFQGLWRVANGNLRDSRYTHAASILWAGAKDFPAGRGTQSQGKKLRY